MGKYRTGIILVKLFFFVVPFLFCGSSFEWLPDFVDTCYCMPNPHPLGEAGRVPLGEAGRVFSERTGNGLESWRIQLESQNLLSHRADLLNQRLNAQGQELQDMSNRLASLEYTVDETQRNITGETRRASNSFDRFRRDLDKIERNLHEIRNNSGGLKKGPIHWLPGWVFPLMTHAGCFVCGLLCTKWLGLPIRLNVNPESPIPIIIKGAPAGNIEEPPGSEVGFGCPLSDPVKKN